jgi:signal transduction histidine kinase
MVAEVTTSVLAGADRPAVYRAIVAGVGEIFQAQSVTLALPDPVQGELRVVASAGPETSGAPGGRLTVDPVSVRPPARRDRLAFATTPRQLDARAGLGPGAAAWFASGAAGSGLISMARPAGAAPFSPDDLDLLADLAGRLSVTVALGRARADQERLAVLEDRHRIARDLHDTVIQDLISLGIQLSREAEVGDAGAQERHEELVTLTEAAVRQLRASVFHLRDAPGTGSLSGRLRSMIANAARGLGHLPTLLLGESVDEIPADVAEQVTAVLQESLSNVARHAGATGTTVAVRVRFGHLHLVVEDDGRGLRPDDPAGHGIENIRRRAADLGGEAVLEPREEGGTRLTWICPLPISGTPTGS